MLKSGLLKFQLVNEKAALLSYLKFYLIGLTLIVNCSIEKCIAFKLEK